MAGMFAGGDERPSHAEDVADVAGDLQDAIVGLWTGQAAQADA